ncbi:MAG: ATP-dependent DNA helicase RecG, partial [Dehalococcoidia bacterium]|nr:ATP-dependent DNA helicase RecG [Dehalococcoidia bacterium]
MLELERRKGYTDKAVIGGLDKYLHKQAWQIKQSINDPQLLSGFDELDLAGSNYSAYGLDERKRWMANVLDWLDKLERATAKKSNQKSVTRSRKLAASRPRQKRTEGLDSPITVIKGVAISIANKFAKLNVRTVCDLLHFFPRRYVDYSQRKPVSALIAGEEQTIIGTIWQARVATLGYRKGTEAIVGDETGNVRVVWFNQPYLAKRFRTNDRVVISGTVGLFKGHKVFESPEWELLEDRELIHTGRLVPVYPLTQGLYPRQLRKWTKEAVDGFARQLDDFLPADIKTRCQFLDLPAAIAQIHYPDDRTMAERARGRLSFDELFLLQLGVLARKRDWQEGQPGNAFHIDREVINRFLSCLPFTLTQAQERVLQEILTDLQQTKAMSRLLQGEVGSGKTVVATAALLMAAANGCQASLMAPTEILAEQHFASIGKLLSLAATEETADGYLKSYSGLLKRPFTLALLLGDSKAAVKKELKKRIKAGEIDIVIGTHALIQKGVTFKRLALAVIDEQHRFGVGQRSALRQKGHNPHMLVMTATPIPRTLALTLYGDLDLSVIDELPPGRQPIKTKWLKPQQRQSAYAFLKKQIAGGRQAFIICPLVEESEAIAARAAIAEYESLSREVFAELRLGLIHGRLSAKEKDEVMRHFHGRRLDILVSTPVVEVGIDVPNATVMLIESADRFGLSQLHQFRGRVGRGEEQSYCMLLSEAPSDVSRQRLDIIESVQDGFALAEEDLKLRGPGEFFG